jgi:hypothetical protein
MRKLVREATIFALLGFLLVSVGLFIKTERDIKNNAAFQATKAVHADTTEPTRMDLPPGAVLIPVNTVAVPLTNGTILHIRRCTDSTEKVPERDVFTQLAEEDKNCRYFSDWFAKFGGQMVSVPLGQPDQIALERDYWTAYKAANQRDVVSTATASLVFGLLWGFTGGVCIWVFYRLVRFAIAG